MTDRSLLVIIQNRETQFDAPLYSLIQRRNLMRLLLVYTDSTIDTSNRDLETGLSPQWDHLTSCAYPSRVLRHTSLLAIFRLALQLRREQPDLVLICGYYPYCHLLLALLLRFMGQRIGLRSDNTLTHTELRGWRGRLRRIRVGMIQRLFHTWHPVGQQALVYLRTLSGTDRPTYRFAYAVDNDWFASLSFNSRKERLHFLAEQQWPLDTFVVLGIMKWNSREDPLTLVDAFQKLMSCNANARLILIGDGPLREAVEATCLPLGDAVIRPGYVAYSQLPVWYGRADVFVHPAPDEPWGVSVTEALACGVPVLAAEGVGAGAEVLLSHQCGGVFPNRDSDRLAEMLIQRSAGYSLHDRAACRSAADLWHYRHTIMAFQAALSAC